MRVQPYATDVSDDRGPRRGAVRGRDVVVPNALARGFGLLGDEWTLFLLRMALQGETRYSAFRAALPISHAVLTNRLETLVHAGLVEKHQYHTHPPRSEYLLTESGRATWPILLAIWGWERSWVPTHTWSTPTIHHTTCDQNFLPVLVCRACGAQVHPQELRATWGPTGGWRECVSEASTRRRARSRSSSTDATRTFYPDTMAVIGNRWSGALVGSAMLGVRRFTDFENHLGVPPGLLSDRLASLVTHGILKQVQTGSRADWAEYRLTDKGLAFYPVIVMVIQWAQRFLGSPEGPAINIRHPPCGNDFVGALVCNQCRVELTGSTFTSGTSD